MKKVIMGLLLVSSLNTIAQEDITDATAETTTQSSLDLGVDFQSRYIWRGLQLGGNSGSAIVFKLLTNSKPIITFFMIVRFLIDDVPNL